jgi:hypothetical protein
MATLNNVLQVIKIVHKHHKGTLTQSCQMADEERALHWHSYIVSFMEVSAAAQLPIDEGSANHKYYYDIVVIILSAESDEDAIDCCHHR